MPFMIDLQPDWPVAMVTFYDQITDDDLTAANDMLMAIAERVIPDQTYAILDCRTVDVAIRALEPLLLLSPEVDLRLLAVGDFPSGGSIFIPAYPTLDAALLDIEYVPDPVLA